MSNVNELLAEIGALTPRTAELLTEQVREYLGFGNFLERHLNDPLTQAEVAQADEVLLAFAAFVLDRPTVGGNDGQEMEIQRRRAPKHGHRLRVGARR